MDGAMKEEKNAGKREKERMNDSKEQETEGEAKEMRKLSRRDGRGSF